MIKSSPASELKSLTKKATKSSSSPKDWRKAIGLLKDTPLAREADDLGHQYRSEQSKP